jgi:hypothetical protein
MYARNSENHARQTHEALLDDLFRTTSELWSQRYPGHAFTIRNTNISNVNPLALGFKLVIHDQSPRRYVCCGQHGPNYS